jgi:hypothetical protein
MTPEELEKHIAAFDVRCTPVLDNLEALKGEA